MAYMIKKINTDEYEFFGSIPVLCKSVNFDDKKKKSLNYIFSTKKLIKHEYNGYLIVRFEIKKGGKKAIK